MIFPEATGQVPGLEGRLNPIRDTHDRTYLYASNVAGQRSTDSFATVNYVVHFLIGEELRLTDAGGVVENVRVNAWCGSSISSDARRWWSTVRCGMELDRGDMVGYSGAHGG